MKSYQVARRLAYATGLVNQELLLQVEYLAAKKPNPEGTRAKQATPVE